MRFRGAASALKLEGSTLEESFVAIDAIFDVAIEGGHKCAYHCHHTCGARNEGLNVMHRHKID